MVILVIFHSYIHNVYIHNVYIHNYGKSPFLMCKSTISMAMFNSYVTNYQRVSDKTSMYSDNEMEKDGELN